MDYKVLEHFVTSEEISKEFDIPLESAKEVVKELGSRIEQMGYIYIKDRIPRAFYERMKQQGFMSDEGKKRKEKIPLIKKRLLDISEFCKYTGLGKNVAYKFAKKIGIEKRIGGKVLFDRESFDEWIDNNQSIKL